MFKNKLFPAQNSYKVLQYPHSDTKCDRSNELVNVLNCSFKGEHPLKELIEDLNQNDTDKMHYKELARVVKAGKGKFREEKTMDVFDEVYEFGIEKGIEQGIEKGSLDSKLETARKMLSGGKIPLSDIAAYTDLPIETIRSLAV